MSERGDGHIPPLLGRRSGGDAGYRRVVGAHRTQGFGGPTRGYLFTVALLAGTASMPIIAAISAGSATVGSTAMPDSNTPFIPAPSVGPVVISLPATSQPGERPATRGVDPVTTIGDRRLDGLPRTPASASPAARLPRLSAPSAPASPTPEPSPSIRAEPTGPTARRVRPPAWPLPRVRPSADSCPGAGAEAADGIALAGRRRGGTVTVNGRPSGSRPHGDCVADPGPADQVRTGR